MAFVEQLSNWIANNQPLLLVALVILIIIAYHIYQKEKKRKEEKKKQKEVKEEEHKSHSILDPDSIHMETDFASINFMEVANLEHLENFLVYTSKEIEEKKVAYSKAKERYQELIEIEQKLRKHIPILEAQREIIIGQIARLKRNMDENDVEVKK